ncbi:MAG: alpha-L-fucosidase [Armatimonadota bacterium]
MTSGCSCTSAQTDRAAWFREARFGMFIHWGLYALLGRGEWVMNSEDIPISEYEKLADQFTVENFDAREWAKLAKRAGMGYFVLTTKHHDGFCLFDSQFTDYTAAKRGPKRDLVREVVDAFRAEGIRIGLYYSLGDWHLPAYQAAAAGDESALPELRRYLHGQLRELMTNYGQVDMLWYDGSFLPAEAWDATAMNAMVRELQPNIMINPRSGIPADFESCENEFHPSPRGVDWEMCTCINDMWGYTPHDYNYKTVNQLIFTLVNCASHGGNFLLNIGPRPDGTIPEEQAKRLEAVGEWMAVHGESVRGTERLPKAMFGLGRVTRKGRRIYIHSLYWPGERAVLAHFDEGTLQGKVGEAKIEARILTTGQPISAHWEGTHLILEGLPAEPPDRADTVITLDVI